MEPLRNELKALEDAAEVNEKKAEDVEATIAALEKSIAKYKDEYAVLISQAQSIKADLASVEAKVCHCLPPLSACPYTEITNCLNLFSTG